MKRRRNMSVISLILALVTVPLLAAQAFAGAGWADSTSSTAVNGKVPTYYANSPSGLRPDLNPIAAPGATIDTGTPLRKFVDGLPGLGEANKSVPLGQYIPVAVPEKWVPPGSITPNNDDYYEIGIVEYTEKMHSDLPKATTLRGYVQLATANTKGKQIPLTYPDGSPILDSKGVQYLAVDNPHYLGPLISATRGVAVRVKYTNLLPKGTATMNGGVVLQRNGDLFLPVDETLMGAGVGPLGGKYTQNRAEIHLHGGDNPWISDGTPHQWTVPVGETSQYQVGASYQNVPDMPDPGQGSGTLYYPNGDSGRLMFYHDHTAGITRLNVYAGEAAGYLLSDQPGTGEHTLTIPTVQIPLVIQERTFVPKDIAQQDARWDTAAWGAYGDLWFPHVYETNQDPTSSDGTNPAGRWDWGQWFWPVFPSQFALPTGVYGDVTTTPEAFGDTPIVNGTAYPTLTVDPTAYRFRILNATNDRFLNLSVFQADPTQIFNDLISHTTRLTEIKMVPAAARAACSTTVLTDCACDPTAPSGTPTGCFPATWPTDGRAGGVPDPAAAGPSMIQIGTEGGLLSAPVIIPPQPINFEYNRRSVTVLNTSDHALLIGPAERADVVIDFSQFAGKTLILYNDAPAPIPAFDPRIDYYTGDPDQTGSGGAPTTLPGYGPNTRTVMQIVVNPNGATPAYDPAPLNAQLANIFTAIQPAHIVGNGTYARIFTGSAQQPTFNFTTADSITYYPFDLLSNTISAVPKTVAANTPITDMPVLNKAIQELFEPTYGRMNATLGVEIPFTSALTQTTIPLGYIDPATEKIGDGETQIWKITHNGVDTHPVHFHLVNVQLINRVGWDGTVKPPDANELGWKETVRMNPLEDVYVAVRAKKPTLPGFGLPISQRYLDPTQVPNATMGFTQVDPLTGNPANVKNVFADFGWEYVWHCHILGHEENDFMRPFIFNYLDTLPLAPGKPTVSATGGGVSLTWTDNSDNEIGFKIEKTDVINSVTTISGTALANSTQAIDSSASPGVAYTYRVIAYNSAGETASPVSDLIIPVVGGPSAPTSPITAVAGNGQATVSFNPPVFAGGGAATISYYTVVSSPSGFSATGATSPITVTGLTNGVPYNFRVSATNSSSLTGPASAASNAVIPATLPGAPVIGVATPGNGQATVAFTPPASNGGSPITMYTATSTPGGFTGTVAPNPSTGAYTPITVAGLTNGTSYTFTVTATNAIGTGPASAPSAAVIPATIPGAPTAVTAAPGNAQATVAFTAPVSDGGSAITLYTVTSSPGNVVATGVASPITVTGLTNGTSYTFTVTATNIVGVGPASVATSPSIMPSTPPAAPTAVVATPGAAQASVAFTASVVPASVNPVTLYTVTSTPGNLTATGSATPIVIAGLTNGTAYSFTVTATNVVGNSLPSASSNVVIPATVPGTPTAITAAAGNTQTVVSFTAPANGGSVITGYTVTATSTTPAATITATGTASPITVTGLTNGVSYTITVSATNAMGPGALGSAAAPVIPVTLPGAPTGVSAVRGNGQAVVSFTAPVSNGGTAITSYTVIPSSGTPVTGATIPITVTGLTNGLSYTFTVVATNAVGTGPASVASSSVTPATTPDAPQAVTAVAGVAQATVSFSAPAFDGGSPITTYTVTSSPGNVVATGAASPIVVTGLANNTNYTFTVTATNAVGVGVASAASNLVTPTATLPLAPTALKAVNSVLSNATPTVTLTWTAAAVNEVGFIIQRATNTAFTAGFTTFTVGANVTTYTDTTVAPSTTYYYRVFAYNALGNSAASNRVTIKSVGQLPTDPTGLTVDPGVAKSLVLNWTDTSTTPPAAPALRFYVQRRSSTNGGVTWSAWTRVATVAAGTTTYTNTGLVTGRLYDYKVQANNAAGSSLFTLDVSAVAP